MITQLATNHDIHKTNPKFKRSIILCPKLGRGREVMWKVGSYACAAFSAPPCRHACYKCRHPPSLATPSNPATPTNPPTPDPCFKMKKWPFIGEAGLNCEIALSEPPSPALRSLRMLALLPALAPNGTALEGVSALSPWHQALLRVRFRTKRNRQKWNERKSKSSANFQTVETVLALRRLRRFEERWRE